MLGVLYNTVRWTWAIKEDKMSTILNMLLDCSKNETMELREVKSLCGKLINIRCLVRDFKFYLGSLIRDSSLNGTDLGAQVRLSD